MATITIRNLAPEIVEALKAMARRNQHSMEQEVRGILETVAVDRASACRQIEEAWKNQSRSTTPEEVDAWVRASRP